FELRWGDRNSVQILRFEMLKQQDELLRLSIWQWPNQQGVDQTQHSGGRTDRQRKCQHGDKRESRLLEQLAEPQLKIFHHDFITVRAQPILDRCVQRAIRAKNMQPKKRSRSPRRQTQTPADRVDCLCRADCPSNVSESGRRYRRKRFLRRSIADLVKRRASKG